MPTAEWLAAQLAPLFNVEVLPYDVNRDSGWGARFGRDDDYAYVVFGRPARGPEWKNVYRNEPAERFTIQGQRPRMNADVNLYNWDYKQSITVSAKKPPLAIAREIRTRLEPDYLKAVDRIQRLNAQDDAERAGRASVSEQLAAILGEGIRHQGGYAHAQPFVPVDKFPGIMGSFEPGRTATDLKLHSIPTDLALAIARTIADWKESR